MRLAQAAQCMPSTGRSSVAECCSMAAVTVCPLLQKLRKRMPNFLHKLLLAERLRTVVLAAGSVSDHAGVEMPRQHLDSETIECRPHGGDLVQNVHAVTVFFQHSLYASDLTGNPIDSCEHFLSRFGIHCCPPPVYPIGV